VFLRKAKGGSGVGEWHWPEDDSVVEVRDDGLAVALLAIPDGGYTKVDGPDPEPKPAAKPAAAKAAAPAAAAAPAKAAPAGK
jgi:hypothetical protein